MDWIKSIREAIDYIEENITDDININDIASQVFVSPFYFQKGFAMLCGFTVSEYIRKRRLSLAGSELLNSDLKIIDVALKYGYDSPDSFTKAFTRFHGCSPSRVREMGVTLKYFAPLSLNFSLKGGESMDYKIVEKEAFTVIGSLKKFNYEEAYQEVPKFWDEHFKSGKGEYVNGMYGINYDEGMDGNEFVYMIADNYIPQNEIPDGLTTRVIPKHTWAVFPCVGPTKKVLKDLNQKIFTEWLPNCKDYEIAEGYNIEMYSDASNYPMGVLDENYYSEIWIPVKKL